MSKLILTGIGDLVANIALDAHPDVTLGPGELLVAMEAAAINPVDFLFASGRYAIHPTVGRGIGSEGIGRVIAAGSDGECALVGHRVIVLANGEQGTWADEAVVLARNLIVVGEEGSAAQLAQLSISPLTAYAMLTNFGSLKAGDWVGQTIGNGAIGQYVIQLAKRAGYKTLSTVRSEQAAQQVRATGGDRVVIQGEDLGGRIATALDGRELALVVDGEGGNTVGQLAHSLKTGGTVVAYSSMTDRAPVIGLGDLIYREINVTGWWLVNWLRSAPRDEIERTYTELAALVAQGEISSRVDASYPLSDYREAITHAASSGRSGKVLFTFPSNRGDG